MEQNREPRNGPSTLWPTQLCGHLIFNKAEKNIQWKKDSLFNKWYWKNWTATYRRMKLDHFITTHTKINPNWMKDLNMRQESIIIQEENTGSSLCDLGCSNFLPDTSPKARKTKAKRNDWDFIRIKSFCTTKEMVNKTKRHE